MDYVKGNDTTLSDVPLRNRLFEEVILYDSHEVFFFVVNLQ